MKTLLTLLSLAGCTGTILAAQPIRQHPENPHWFEWRGQPVALITSAEHYGGVVVELTLSCFTYSDKQWAIHPLNPTNNLQALAVPDWKNLHALPQGTGLAEARTRNPVFSTQEALVRWLVCE